MMRVAYKQHNIPSGSIPLRSGMTRVAQETYATVVRADISKFNGTSVVVVDELGLYLLSL
jgi:hypothetical protein